MVYFLSDMHLGAGYIADRSEHETRIVRFLDSIADDATAVYLLGDILDYWYEYRTVVPRGYIRFFGALARLADRGVKIMWIIGNHDIWLFDYLAGEIGLTVADGNVEVTHDGVKFLLAHGDGVGCLDPGFKFIRSMFRSRFCQKLYAAIHPRWTVSFAHRWSSHSRCSGNDATSLPSTVRQFACDYAAAHSDCRYIVMGHHHIMLDEAVTDTCRLVILGDWINLYSYAVWDGKVLQLRQFDA